METYRKLNVLSLLAALLVASTLVTCGQLDLSSSETAAPCFETGDIVVSNSGSDVVLVLDSAGTYKGVALNVINSSETVYGLGWMHTTGELLVAVDGADRIEAVSAAGCTSRVYAANSNLTGNLRGLTQLISGDVLVVESNNIERFDPQGYRVTTGAWPKTLQTTGTGLHRLQTAGFVHCSTGTDAVRTYSDAGVQVATVASGIAATTDVADCMELQSGNIAAVFSGTTDTLRVYDSSLSSVVSSYSDLGVLSTPGGIAQRANGNLIVIDRVLNYLVEVTEQGEFVGILGDSVLSTPEFILVVP